MNTFRIFSNQNVRKICECTGTLSTVEPITLFYYRYIHKISQLMEMHAKKPLLIDIRITVDYGTVPVLSDCVTTCAFLIHIFFGIIEP